MQSAPVRSLFDVITDFLATNPTPEAIIVYKMPEDLQARAIELLEKNGEDELTDQEREEMQEYIFIDELFALLKIKTRIKLRNAEE